MIRTAGDIVGGGGGGRAGDRGMTGVCWVYVRVVATPVGCCKAEGSGDTILSDTAGLELCCSDDTTGDTNLLNAAGDEIEGTGGTTGVHRG